MILVVRGGANYSEILPPNTYINADDFATGRDLAMYLNKLGSSEDEYTGYLRRKDGYQVVTEQESVLAAFCGLCWRLNDLHTYRGSVQNVTQWWFDACQWTGSQLYDTDLHAYCIMYTCIHFYPSWLWWWHRLKKMYYKRVKLYLLNMCL